MGYPPIPTEEHHAKVVRALQEVERGKAELMPAIDYFTGLPYTDKDGPMTYRFRWFHNIEVTLYSVAKSTLERMVELGLLLRDPYRVNKAKVRGVYTSDCDYRRWRYHIRYHNEGGE